MDKQIVEYESTIEYIGDFNFSPPDDAKTDVIFLIADGLRLSMNKCQRKVVTDTQRIVYFNDGFLPIKRTIANETLVAIPSPITVERAIHRTYWYRDNVRHSINVVECEQGRKTTYETEIEYNESTSYQEIVRLENMMMKSFPFKFEFDKLNFTDIFNACSVRVQMCQHYRPDLPSLWAPKWNGIKSKIAFIDGFQYLWGDLQNPTKSPCVYDKILENICFACEILDDGDKIVFDIPLLRYDNKNYNVEPTTNVEILKILEPYLKKLGIKIQHFKPKNELDVFNSAKMDGYIIVQEKNVIKWKYPTIDVEYDGTKFLVGDNRTFEAPSELMLIPGQIYELSGNRIMRRRTDRITYSNEQEYQAYLKAIQFCENAKL